MKKILSLALAICAACDAGAQDVHFSQFYETSILRNPALMGSFRGDYKIGALYRSQWSSISKPFTTGVVNAESRMPVNGESGDYFAVGLLAYYDQAGSIDLQTIGLYPAISFNKYLGDGSRTFLSAGFTGGYLQRSFDPAKMTTNSQYIGGHWSPENPTGEIYTSPSISNWDLGAGLALSGRSDEEDRMTYYAALSLYHFTRPKRSFSGNDFIRLDMKWNVGAGLSYRLTDQYGIQTHVNYTRQGVYNEFVLGGLLGWKRITNNEADPPLSLYLGVYYRFKDAAIPTAKIDYKRISITTSYDFTTSKLRPANSGNGGFEVSLTHSGLFNSSKYERSRTLCPKPW